MTDEEKISDAKEKVTEAVKQAVSPESQSMEKFFQDLAKSLKQSEERARRLITKMGDPTKGKPSRKALANTFGALFDLIQTCSTVERCTMGHTQGIARHIDVRLRSLVRLFVDRGLITLDELKEKTKVILEEDEKAEEARKQSHLEESLDQAKEEASKR